MLIGPGMAGVSCRTAGPESRGVVCADRELPLTLRRQEDYDYCYHCVAGLPGEHLIWLAEHLTGG
jgi:hypothetical protein